MSSLFILRLWLSIKRIKYKYYDYIIKYVAIAYKL